MTRIRPSMSQNRNRCSNKKYIRFDHDLLAAIESIKPNDQSFSAWVKSACWTIISQGHQAILPREDSHHVTYVDEHGEAMIIELNRKGLFNQQIADTLNQQGLKPPKGKCWTRTAINDVLKTMNSKSSESST
jgi:hypothetical protein